jgi:hypothetical protein
MEGYASQTDSTCIAARRIHGAANLNGHLSRHTDAADLRAVALHVVPQKRSLPQQ